MANTVQFSGFAEGDALLSQLPLLLRGQAIDKALKSAINRLAAASASKAPKPGTTTGGIAYTPRRGERASRRRLYQSIRGIIRHYDQQDTTVAVGGPVRKYAGRQSHLIEFGWNHTTGGTLQNSGARTRYAMKTVSFDRIMLGGKPQWVRRQVRDEKRRGTGRITRKIPGRSFILSAFDENKGRVQEEIIGALRKFAEDLEKQKNRSRVT